MRVRAVAGELDAGREEVGLEKPADEAQAEREDAEQA